jgi:3,4-dihydroxy 2-butanone 4-phosphate synthase/GTP cyclohydrolase II
MALSSIEDALIALRDGRPVLVADDENRENEVDAIMAAQLASTEWIAWMIRYTSGYLCAPMTEQRANHLDLNLMATTNQDPFKTQYTITVDASSGVTTGISAADRAHTLRVLSDAESTKDSLIRPGHVIPLRAHQNGVLDRRGHTEATVDLMKLAGLAPVGVIGEMTNEDGSMTRLEDAYAIGEKYNLPVITIDQIVKMRLDSVEFAAETVNDRIRFEAEAKLPTTHGDFRVRGYYDIRTTADHVAIIAGNPTGDDVLIRMHSECITGEAFGSLKCECGPQLEFALDQIANDPKGGIVIYLRGQEGRGIGLLNKLKAYALQDKGYDTVDANLALGLPSEAREYGAAVSILRDLGVTSVRLMTNNPAKSSFLNEAGIHVNSYVPVIVGAASQNEQYLETKRARMGHMIPEGN